MARSVGVLVLLSLLLLAGCVQSVTNPNDEGNSPSDSAPGQGEGGDINPDIIAILLKDTDGDGLSDLVELDQGLDPNDPHDGPDIDGDGIANKADPDVDGDGVPNNYDDDTDDDGIWDRFDSDRDADGEENAVDADDDGDGVKDDVDDDDDADGKADQDPGNEDDEEEFDVLALARRLFDDAQAQEANQPPDSHAALREFRKKLGAIADRMLKDAQSRPVPLDLRSMAREFFTRASGEALGGADDQQRDSAVRDFFRDRFDKDGDGLWDVQDPDPDGDADRDNDDDDLPDLVEVRMGTDLNDPDTDNDGLDDGQEKQAGLDPLSGDSDKDGVPDGQERIQP
jgi:hypothetical protein